MTDHSDTEAPRRGLSRRQLLAATAVGAVAAVAGTQDSAPTFGAVAQAQPVPSVGVRRSIYSLDPNGPIVIALRRGIGVMKSRPFEDPTSWAYQAAIHGLGAAPPPGLPQQMVNDMRQCVHGVPPGTNRRFFLPWHRCYLHFFERILRAASGDPTLTLPYWNYSVPGQAALPLPFRFPADPAMNPLYEPRRSGFQPNVNAGEPLDFFVVDDRQAMAQFSFDSFSDGFEGTPHGAVHVAVGGFTPTRGLMSSVPTSAQDPIFWLHHCNVDRAWTQWLASAPGAQNPVGDPGWMGQEWAFYDENGNRQTMRAGDTIDTTDLGYIYDDELPPFPGFQPIVVADASEAAAIEESLATGGAVTLSGRPETVTADSGEAAEAAGAEVFFTPAEGDARPVILRLEGITYDEAPGVIYQVYVNLPDDAEADPRGPYFAGVLAPFGLERSEAPIELDITGLLNRQIENEQFVGGSISVAFRPYGIPDEAAEAGVAVPPVSVETISIVRK